MKYCEFQCDAQLTVKFYQDIREEVFEAFGRETVKVSDADEPKKKRLKQKTDLDTGREWTTWEAYNWILKGMVDEMIDLGAKPSLKVIVLQLWTSYLKKIKVAFLSKKKQELPNLSPTFDLQDAYLVTGVKLKVERTSNKGSFNYKSKKSSSASVTSSATATSYSSYAESKKRLLKSKRTLMIAEARRVEKDMASSLDFSSQLEQSLRDRETVSSDKETVISCSSQKSSCRSRKGLEERKNVLSKLCGSRRKYKSPTHVTDTLHFSSKDPIQLTRTRILNFIHLGLLLDCAEQQLSDMLRWIREGHLSFQHVTHFFPEEVKILSSDRARFGNPKKVAQYSSINEGSERLAHFLGVKYIPIPDLNLLLQRQVRELGLPDMMVKLTENLFEMIPVLPYSKTSISFCCYEVQIMAMIIFILKLLFGLDDKTEHTISGVAKRLNELHGGDNFWLFDWDSWVCWVEKRRKLLSKHHAPTRDKVNPNGKMDTDMLIDHWKRGFKDERRAEMLRNTVNKHTRGMKPHQIEILKQPLLQLLVSESPASSKMYFPSTLVPQSTYSRIILENLHLTDQDDLLKNFHASDMSFLLNPSKISHFASSKNINLMVLERSARLKFRRVKRPSKFFKKTPNTALISVVPNSFPLYSTGQTKILKRSYKSLKYPLNVEDENFDTGNVGHILPISCEKSDISVPAIETHLVTNGKKGTGIVKTFKRRRRRRRRVLRERSETPQLEEEAENVINAAEISKMISKNFLNFHLKLLSKYMSSSGTDFFQNTHVLEESELKLLKKTDSKFFASTKKKLLKEARRDKLMCLKLYLPFRHYWIYEGDFQTKRILQSDFKNIMGTFPVSFSWLLNQCANILEVDERSLYCELLRIEAAASCLQNSNS